MRWAYGELECAGGSEIWCRAGALARVRVNESAGTLAVVEITGTGTMSELRVDPSEIHRSGVDLGNIATAVKAAFLNSDTEIASAQAGWMGESANALASVAAEWQQTMHQVVEILFDHGDKFTTAAKQYGQVDESEADSLRGVSQSL